MRWVLETINHNTNLWSEARQSSYRVEQAGARYAIESFQITSDGQHLRFTLADGATLNKLNTYDIELSAVRLYGEVLRPEWPNKSNQIMALKPVLHTTAIT